MSNPDRLATLAYELHIEPDAIRFARGQWGKDNIMRQILNSESKRLIEAARNTLETCGPDDLKEIQGRIAGIKAFAAAMNAQGDV